MFVTQYRPWYVQATPAARQACGRYLDNATGESAANEGAPSWTPRVDVREETGRFVISADLPGVDPASIDVQMEKNVLTLKGERKADALPEGARLARGERRHGAFDRRFVLPDSADADGIVANGSNGVLEIVIPKKAQSAPRRIAINA